MKYKYIKVNNSAICRYPIHFGKESKIGEIYSYVNHVWVKSTITTKFKTMKDKCEVISEKEALKLIKEV